MQENRCFFQSSPTVLKTAWLCVLTAIVIVWGESVAASSVPRDPEQYFFSESFGDFTEELELAREEGKSGILIFFEMDECPFCHRMKESVLNLPQIQDFYRDKFLCFSVDIEGDTEVVNFDGRSMTAKDFAKANRVRATPVFAFFDLSGKRVVRFTGATSNAQEFLWLGEFVAGSHFETTNFTRFKRDRKAAADGQTLMQ